MLVRASNFLSVLLLGVLMAWQALLPLAPDTATNNSHSTPACCRSRCSSCGGGACCAKSSSSLPTQSPAASSTTRTEWQAVASLVASWIPLPVPAPGQQVLRAPSSLATRVIPIFQRDCAYLI